ncbi:MAG: DUF5615 family PIN-like protein, partial [Gemmatimonadota bacterium]
MRLLLDECVPRPLKHDLAGHEVAHVRDLGWSGKRNGEILRLMVGARLRDIPDRRPEACVSAERERARHR